MTSLEASLSPRQRYPLSQPFTWWSLPIPAQHHLETSTKVWSERCAVGGAGLFKCVVACECVYLPWHRGSPSSPELNSWQTRWIGCCLCCLEVPVYFGAGRCTGPATHIQIHIYRHWADVETKWISCRIESGVLLDYKLTPWHFVQGFFPPFQMTNLSELIHRFNYNLFRRMGNILKLTTVHLISR